MEKRGQVTIFIIIGIVIIIIVIGTFFLINAIVKGTFTLQREKAIVIPSQLKPVTNFIDSCVKSTTVNSIDLISLQGGYLNPVNSITFVNAEVPYYLLNRRNVIPSKNFIENELAKNINSNLDFCIQDYNQFKQQGLTIQDQDFITNINIQKDKVLINLDYSITISKGNITVTLTEFTNEVDSRLDKIYDIANELVEEHLKNPSGICLSCMNRLSVENGVLIDVNNYDDKTFIFTITDPLTEINNKPHIFRFAISI